MSGGDEAAERLRLDKWLWRARFYKTRALAAEAVEAGKIRVNGVKQTKPGAGLKLGDALTIAKSGRVFVVAVEAFGDRRGPAAEARTLYRDLDAKPATENAPDDGAVGGKRRQTARRRAAPARRHALDARVTSLLKGAVEASSCQGRAPLHRVPGALRRTERR